MATTIRLSRPSAQQPWGFRIHGGRDFHQPLIVLKVTAGSIASSAGLNPGDTIAKINNKETAPLNHKDAENLIKNAGNAVEFEIYKTSSSTWKPNVTVLADTNNADQPNVNLVNKQFNTPINLYSEQSIAETLSAQAEVLAGGAIGVNFKKNEKKYNYEDSEVYKMLQEVENDTQQSGDENYGGAPAPISPAASGKFPAHHFGPSQAQNQVQQQQVRIPPVTLKPVQLPQQQQQQQQPLQQQPLLPQQQQVQASPTGAPAQQPLATAPVTAPQNIPGVTGQGGNPNICAECERLIVGVFVRIKEKNLHVDCFKCSTCGQSLKNIGYFNINNKLYCDIHAKTVAKATVAAPAPGLEPQAFLPGQPLPPSALPVNTSGVSAGAPFSYTQPPQQQPLNLPSLDSYAANIAPQPYHHSPSGGAGVSHVTAPKSPQVGGVSPKFPAQLPSFQPPPPASLQQIAPLPTFQPLQQQQQQSQQSSSSTIQQSSSSSYESYQKSSSSSFVTEQTLGSGSKVIWPPLDQPLLQAINQPQPGSPTKAPSAAGAQQQVSPNKFKQQQVPYKPLSSLLVASQQPASPQQQQQQQQQRSQFSQQQANQQFSQFGQTAAQQQLFNNQSGLTNSAGPQLTSPFSSQPQQQSVAPPQPTFAPQQQYVAPPQPTFAPQPQPIVPKPTFSAPPPAARPTFGAPPPPAPASGAGSKSASSSTIANRIGRGILTQPGGPRVAVCGACQKQIRGPFVTAGVRFYCPEHFKCATCQRDLMEVGFVEEKNNLHCEFCWESTLAPVCSKCNKRVKHECLKAIGREFHPTCFACKQCGKAFGKDSFFLEDGEPYCQNDWNELFTTKCHGCGFPIEAGDRWVEAMNNNYHSQCFNCTACKKNLEGQSFFAKAGRPFCKSHAR